MAKEGETFFFYLSTCLVNSSLVYFPRQLVNSSTCQLVTLIQYSLNYAKKYIKFCRL